MDKTQIVAINVIAFAAFSVICYFGASVLIPIVLAILTSYLLDPVVNALTRIRIPKGLAIGAAMLLAFILIGIIVALFLARAQEMSEYLPKYRSKIRAISSDIRARIRWLEKRSEDISETIMPPAPNQPRTVRVEEPSRLSELLFGRYATYVVQFSFFPFLVFFLLAEKDDIRSFISYLIRSRTNLSHAHVEGTSEKIVNDINGKVRGFVVGYLWSTILLFIISWIVFVLFGVQQGLIWAMIFAFLNILPFVGAFLSAIPPIAIAILQFASIQKTIVFIVVCIALHLIYANVLIPRTTGPRTELSPLAILLAMMYWGFIWGAIGIFLAIPLTASLRSIYVQYRKLTMHEPAMQS